MSEEPSPFKDKPPERFRMLPCSDIAERGVVCSYMLAPLHVSMLCQEREFSSAYIHHPALKVIFEVMVKMMDDGMRLDEVTLTQKLHDLGILEQVGGAAFISELFTYLPTATNVEAYLKIVEEKALLRELIAVCGKTSEEAWEAFDGDPAELIAKLHGKVTSLTLKGVRQEKTFRDILMQTEERWRSRREGTSQQIRTGFERLDRASPLRRKHTLVISGREKSGKSALAGCIVKNVTTSSEPMPALVFSLEMPSEEWCDRLISDVGSISQRHVHNGVLDANEWDDAAKAIHWLHNAPIEIHDSLLALPQIVAKMRQWKTKNPTGALVVIDYLQLIDVGFVKGRNREQEVALMSKTLRNVGKELDVALVELCQLNNNDEARESRAIQQDCTAFWQVREEYDDKGQIPKGKENLRTVHVRFQRHGGRNIRIPFVFTGDVMRFTEEEQIEQGEFL